MELAKSLVMNGNEVHVICRRNRSQPKREIINGITFHRIYRGTVGPLARPKRLLNTENGASGRRATGMLYFAYLQSAFALYSGMVASQTIRSNRLEAIIERETAFGAGAMASIITHRPMVMELIGPRYSQLSMLVSHRLFAYNESMVPEGARTRTLYVDAAVNPDIFHPDAEAGRRIREQFGVRDEILVGYVGSFQKWHGVADLLKAATIVLRTLPNVKFILIGPSYEWAQELVQEMGLTKSVFFSGPVPYSLVPSFINACDMLVAPYNISDSERASTGIGSPLKILEYMACGKATIGSSLPQVKNLIQHGVTGLRFPPGDQKTLSAQIIELAINPSFREEIGGRAMENVRLKYTWVNLAAKIQSTLTETVKNS
jgi:glycosyltransferase involved in cell wall biosynthesis